MKWVLLRDDNNLAPPFHLSAAQVKASVQESLKRLQTDYVDILQVHDMEFGDLDQVGRDLCVLYTKSTERWLL